MSRWGVAVTRFNGVMSTSGGSRLFQTWSFLLFAEQDQINYKYKNDHPLLDEINQFLVCFASSTIRDAQNITVLHT